MEQVLSAKLKLTPTTEQKNWLRAVSLAYRDALNYAARVAEFLMSRLEATLARYAKSACSASVNANDLAKVALGTKLQKLVRYSIYPIYGLPAQIAFDTTTAFCAWSSQANSAFGHFRSYKAFLGLSTHSLGMSLVGLPREIRIITQHQTHSDNFSMPHGIGGSEFKKRILISHSYSRSHGAEPYSWRGTHFIRGAIALRALPSSIALRALPSSIASRYITTLMQKILLPRGQPRKLATQAVSFLGNRCKRYYRLVSLKLELSEITSAVRLRVVGVEEGCWYLAVATEAQERLRVSSFGAAPLAHKERARVAHKRGAVASKELGCLFVAHCPRQSQFFSGKQVIHKASCYQSTRRRLQRRSTRSAKQQGRANRNQGKWSFAELLGFIDYKAVNSGSLAIKVDADYTFQSYLGCKSVTRANRSKKGLLFHCENYGFEQHADFVGDRNIPGGMVLTWQDSSRTGCILAIADVSSVDSKTDSKRQLFRAEVGHRLEAERLRRPTIPVLKEVGQDS